MIKSLIITTVAFVIANSSVFANEAETIVLSSAEKSRKLRHEEAVLRKEARELKQEKRAIRQEASQEARIIRQEARVDRLRQEVEVAKQESEVRQRPSSDRRENVDEETRMQRRVEMQLRRMSEEFNLTEEQLEEATKLFIKYEKMQNEFRAKLNELNKEKMEKFDELLTEEQRKLRDENNNNRTLRHPTDSEGMRRIRLNASPDASNIDENIDTDNN